MDERQLRIAEDLSSELTGEIRCDPVTTAIYASDASLYQIRPLGVAFPQDADDVRTLARYALEQDLPLVPRGAGTNVSGGAVGAGLIVDFSRHMTRLLADEGDTIRVEPGITLERLNQQLRPSGRYFAPDPASYPVTTIGGMIATNAAGSHSIHIGATREHVASLETILAGGTTFEAQHPLTNGILDETDPIREIRGTLTRLLSEQSQLIESKRPRTQRNNCGYHVWDCLTPEGLDLSRLLVGSEGTLGLFTAATLRVLPIPEHRGVALLLFNRIESALEAVLALLPEQPAACDLMDRRLLSLARDGDPRFKELITIDAEAALLVEVIGDSSQDATQRLNGIEQIVQNLEGREAARAISDTDAEGVDFLWTLSGKVVPRLTHLKGRTRPLPIVEDIAVPPEAMQEFRIRAQKVFQRHQVTATLYAHAGAGQMHFRPFLTPPEAGGAGGHLEALARDLYQVVLALGGVVSGEHGDGLARTAFVRTQYGPLYRLFQQIKQTFDPNQLLNPGKIVSNDPKATIRHLRPPAQSQREDGGPDGVLTDLKLRWDATALIEETIRCNGCGTCRSQEPGLRMCPFFRIESLEEAAPRSKAAAMRMAASGELSADDSVGPDMARLMSHCFNCKQCVRECPSEVDIPHLVIEAKAARLAAQDQPRSEWALSRMHLAGPIGNGFSFLANPLLSSPLARWLLEKTVGLARHRKVPRFARRSFLTSMPRRCRVPREGPNGERAVIYFVDDFANYFDPELAHAFVRVCERQGIPVFVPPEQLASGMPLVSAGDTTAARQLAEENLRILGPYAREGYRIVCTEPSAAVCLKREYPVLLDHPDVVALAEQTIEAGAFLRELQQAGNFNTQFIPLPWHVAYHTPCHVRFENPEEPFHQLLALIPGLSIHKIEEGCSGMAGAWGLSTENFQKSLRIGWPLITAMRDDSLVCGVTECGACKMQMEQGTSRATLHPLKLLDWSYAGQHPPLPRATNRLVTS